MHTDTKSVRMLGLLFTLTYMVSYITRINYGAVISEMVTSTGFSKEALSTGLVGSFITYGIGQIVSGVLGDRVSPKRLIQLGLTVTAVMNILLPLCVSPWQMAVVWSVNGFAQSFMWPPVVRLMTENLSPEDYKKTMVWVSYGSGFGTVLVYLLSPLVIAQWGWRWVFPISAAAALVMLAVFSTFRFTRVSSVFTDTAPKSIRTGFFMAALPLTVLLAIVLQGMLRDGVTTWMPTYISQTFDLKNTTAILTGALLPVFGMLCYSLASLLHRKKFQDPLVCGGVLFGLGALSAALLAICGKGTPLPAVLFSALLTGSMHGVNLMLICMLPPLLSDGRNVSTVSGVMNACTYVGSALSTYGFAAVSARMGWSFTVYTWVAMAVLGTAFCFLSAFRRKKTL